MTTAIKDLDTARYIATPEGSVLTLRLAGPVVRARAWFLDFCLRMVILMIAGTLLSVFNRMGGVVMALLAFGLEWLYPVAFEVFWQGSTPGKRWSDLVVLNEDGTPVDLAGSFIRNTLRAVDFMPVLYGAGLATMLLGNGFQRLGDLAAGTVVVYRDQPPPMPRIAADASSLAPPMALNLDEQRALIEFVRRAPTLTEERTDELAELVEPLTEGLTPSEGRERLLSIGHHLLGHR